MRCSADVRQRVMDFVRHGGSKAEAARRFKVGEASVYRWLKPGGMACKRPGPRLTVHYLVIMDNAAFHKSAETAALIEATGATRLFLPPYSPDFNPIEQNFASLKKRREYQDQATLEEIVKAYQ